MALIAGGPNLSNLGTTGDTVLGILSKFNGSNIDKAAGE